MLLVLDYPAVSWFAFVIDDPLESALSPHHNGRVVL